MQGWAAPVYPPVCLLAGNSQPQQGQIDLVYLLLFFPSFFSFSLSLNSLLPKSVKLKQHREQQGPENIWEHLDPL
jgi:hypothetical protein